MSVGAVTWFMLSLAMEGIMGVLESCVHGGTEYGDGDFFLPNETMMKAEGPGQCVQCRCRQGLVLCEIDNCPSLECETPVRNSRLCCPRCPDSAKGSKESEESSEVVIETRNVDSESRKNGESECFSNGKRFRNGSSWQPVMGPLGVMACVECRCDEGVIICGRVQCQRPSCPQPRRRLGQCCPVCPSSAESGRKAFCLPRLNQVFVFRTENVRNNSDRIEYAFLENEWNNEAVKIHTWNLRAKNLADVLTVSTASRKELRDKNLQILGSMTKRRLRKYSKREKKLRGNCLVKCLAKIARLEKALVEYSVSARSKCEEDEVDVAELFGGP